VFGCAANNSRTFLVVGFKGAFYKETDRILSEFLTDQFQKGSKVDGKAIHRKFRKQ